MKTHHITQLVLLACIIGILANNKGQAEITKDNQRKIDLLVEMTADLREEGLQGFLSRSSQQGWTAPKIFSAWYIARLPDDANGLKKVEEAKSNLGLELARQLSVVAKTVRETKEIAQLEIASEALFGAVDWIGREPGYGNLLLQWRAYDVASVAAIKFMADLSYPIEKAEAAMKRFDWRWSKPANRRRVLFEESNGRHFRSDKNEITDEELDLEFRQGVSHVLKLGNIGNQPDLGIFIIDSLRASEDFAVPETTWQHRGHVIIGETGLGSANFHNLEPLHEFRKRYGKFPTKPVKYVKGDGDSDIKAAFWELSWEKPFGVGGAWVVYEQYLGGRLEDAGYTALQGRGSVAPQSPK